MAVNVVTNDIVTARLEFLLGTDVGYNVLHYRISGVDVIATGLPSAIAVPFDAMANEMAQAVYESFDGPWSTIASFDVAFTGVTVQDIYPAPRSRPYTYLPAENVVGLRLSEALPFQDTLTVLKKSIYGERWGLGRVFICGLAENQQAGGNIIAGARADLITFAHMFNDVITFDAGDYRITIQPVLFNEVKEGDPPVGTGVYRTTPILTSEIDSWSLKTQRRRRPGKGI